MEADWHLKKAREIVAWMKDELQRTNDPEEIKLWNKGVELGNEFLQLLEEIEKLESI